MSLLSTVDSKFITGSRRRHRNPGYAIETGYPGFLSYESPPAELPDQLRAHLSDTPGQCVCRLSELAAGEVSHWTCEVRVIENVEEFGTKLDGRRPGNPRILHQSEIRIDDSRSIKEPGAGIANHSKLFRGERPRQKVLVRPGGTGLARILFDNRSNYIGEVDSSSGKGKIAGLAECDRKAGGKAADAAYQPSFRKAAGRVGKGALEGYRPRIADN